MLRYVVHLKDCFSIMNSVTPIITPHRQVASLSNQSDYPDVDHRLALPIKLFFLTIVIPIHISLGSIFITGVRMLLIILMIPMLYRLLSGRYGRIILTDVLFFLYAVWIVLTLSINSPASAISYGGSVGVEFFGGYMLARAYIRTPQDMAAMAKILLFTVLFTIPFALYEGQTGAAFIPELIRKLPMIDSVANFYSEGDGRRLGLERVQVVFAHPIHYGLYGSTALSLIIVGFKGVFTNTQRAIAGILICFATFLSLSSGAILPIVMQLGFIFWAWALGRVQRRWHILVGIIAVCYVMVDLLSNRTPIDVFMSYATFSPHNAYWRKLIFEWGMKNVWANPIVGHGLNDWFRLWFMYSSSVDNYWLLSTMRYGIPGFVMLAVGFFLPVWNIAGRKIEEKSLIWKLRRAWIFTILGLTLTLCTVDVWATIHSYVAFLFGSGMWLLSVKRPEVHSLQDIRRGSKPAATTAADTPEPPSPISRYTRFAAIKHNR